MLSAAADNTMMEQKRLKQASASSSCEDIRGRQFRTAQLGSIINSFSAAGFSHDHKMVAATQKVIAAFMMFFQQMPCPLGTLLSLRKLSFQGHSGTGRRKLLAQVCVGPSYAD